MENRKEKPFAEIGDRIRLIRKELGLRVVEVSKEAGISISYIYDFEGGRKVPHTKYLRYLHDRHNVNLNYIFFGETNMFKRGTKNPPPYFTQLQDAIDKLLCFMHGDKIACYSILAYSEKYKLKNGE